MRSEREKKYGIQIDSLSDMTSFVILPGAISIGLGNDDIISVAICVFYALAGMIRLGYFNVLASESEIKFYTGLPVPVIAIVIPILWLISPHLDDFLTTVVFDATMTLLAVLFISNIRIKKPGKAFEIILGILGAIGIVLILLL